MDDMRVIYGGYGPQSGTVTYPAIVPGYDTVRCGWAEAVQPAEGETAIRVSPGSPYEFAVWVVGDFSSSPSPDEGGWKRSAREMYASL